ncbi:MAG TPA: VCBS repeat-containing protein, partial [Microthrixaceae bacterium]|nr:VCBS repeat-containing protein [Microthrixaceae bacterium]
MDYGDRTNVKGAGIGDVNGDGYGDVAIAWSGTVDVHLGGPDGPLPDPTWRLVIGTNDFSDVRNVTWVGDMNEDGLAEVFVAAPLEGVPVLGQPGWYYPSVGVVGIWSGAEVADIDQDGIPNDEDCRPWLADHEEVVQDRCDEDGDGTIACWRDDDGDGFGGTVVTLPVGSVCAALPAGDCDDADPGRHPGAIDVPDDDLDQDCDGAWTCHADLDGDGHGAVRPVPGRPCSSLAPVSDASDCDDDAASAYPGGAEVSGNLIDEDCDGRVSCARDDDGDGWAGAGVATSPDRSCDHPGLSSLVGDCDDADATVNPWALDVVTDDLDNDCDGWRMCVIDADRDGWNGVLHFLYDVSCSTLASWGQPSGDCDDGRAGVNPAQPQETSGEYDSNCDGFSICYYDRDGDDDGDPATAFVESRLRKDNVTWICSDRRSGPAVIRGGDCDDTDPEVNAHRAHERPEDGRDQDCDGLRACALDADGDGFGHNQRAANNVPGVPSRWFEQIADPTCTTPGYTPYALATDC